MEFAQTCACGQETKISDRSSKRDGTVKGQPMKFIHGHHRRKSFVEYVEEDRGYITPCWIWQKAISGGDRSGYGHMFDAVAGKMRPAHIVYWERVNGPVPEGHELDHLCRQRPCINPKHTEPVTDAVNTQRGNVTKLTAEDVLGIRHNVTGHTKRQLATIYGVSISNIKMILLGKTWKNLLPPKKPVQSVDLFMEREQV